MKLSDLICRICGAKAETGKFVDQINPEWYYRDVTDEGAELALCPECLEHIGSIYLSGLVSLPPLVSHLHLVSEHDTAEEYRRPCTLPYILRNIMNLN